MAIIRLIVGRILLLLNYLTLPKRALRSKASLQELESKLRSYSLYQFEACPFCIKVRRALHRLNLPLELRDAKQDSYRDELLREGGRVMVPCLRIESEGDVKWMYESGDIIRFLEEEFPVE